MFIFKYFLLTVVLKMFIKIHFNLSFDAYFSVDIVVPNSILYNNQKLFGVWHVYCVFIQHVHEFGASCLAGFIVLPFSIAILSIGNLVVLLGLWPAQVLGTYYAIARYGNCHISWPPLFYRK